MHKRKISQVTGGGPALKSRRRRRSGRTGAKSGDLDEDQKDTQTCWGRYLKPNGWKHVAGNLEDHIFIPVALQKYSTYIIKNAGEEGVHFFDGYAGLKKHFVDKRYPSIVGEDIPDTATNAFKNWFKKRYKMIQYSPEPTARMKEWLRNKESTDTKALGQSSASLSSSSSQTTLNLSTKDTQATVHSSTKDTQTTVALPTMDNKYWAIIEKKGLCGLCHQEVHKKMHRMPQGAGYVHSSCFWKNKFEESQRRLLALERDDPANIETQVYSE